VQKILALKSKKHPVKKVVDYLTVEEMAAITDSVDITAPFGIRDVVLISLMYDLAARVQEMADLTVLDVKLYSQDTSSVYVTGKWQKTRSVPLSTPSFYLLKRYIEEAVVPQKQSLLFLNRSGGKLTRHGISLILKKYVEKAKMKCPNLASKKISPHTLRHSKAMHLLKAGIDLIKIRDFLGHESVVTTEIYARTHDTDLRIALNAVSDLESPKATSWHSDPGIMARLASFAKKKP
jgi:site-specific recombinase XerD